MVYRLCPIRYQRTDEAMQTVPLWCCVNCGDRTDEAIRFHRALRTVETRAQRNARILREIQVALRTMEVT